MAKPLLLVFMKESTLEFKLFLGLGPTIMFLETVVNGPLLSARRHNLAWPLMKIHVLLQYERLCNVYLVCS